MRRWILHPVLFALFPVLFLYARNPSEAQPSDVALVGALAVALALVLWGASWLLLRDVERAAILASALTLLFFAYGHAKDAGSEVVKLAWPNGYVPHRVMIAAWILLAGTLAIVLFRRRKPVPGTTRVLHVVAAFLVVSSGLTLALHASDATPAVAAGQAADAAAANASELPDIYYLMVDGYANPESLQEFFGYDDGNFTRGLEAKGLHVVAHSRSNYPTTGLSLGSTLNLDYVNDITKLRPPDSTDYTIPVSLIMHNKLVDVVKERGYRYVLFETGWPPTSVDPRADTIVRCSRLSAFDEAIMRTSALVALASKLNVFEREKHDRIECQFREVGAFASSRAPGDAPAFAFAHLIVPHPPYVFAADGGPVEDPDYDNEYPSGVDAARARYVAQLEYTNRRVEEAVAKIQASARGPSVIVVMSDHGSAFTWNTSAPFLRERLRNFEALYVPGHDEIVYDGMTPVNVFRAILNAYAGTRYEKLPDVSYFQPRGPHYFYDLVDVTDQVGYGGTT